MVESLRFHVNDVLHGDCWCSKVAHQLQAVCAPNPSKARKGKGKTDKATAITHDVKSNNAGHKIEQQPAAIVVLDDDMSETGGLRLAWGVWVFHLRGNRGP